jgi:arylformamidase
MPIYDVTVPLRNEMPTYPGDPGIQIRDWLSLANGDPANVSLLNFGAHTGTHVDAPAHFIEGGEKSESLPLAELIGEAQVVEVPESYLSIDESFVSKLCEPDARRILFKTRNSLFWGDQQTEFRSDFTYLQLAAARRLVQQGIKLLGIDYLSIEQFGQKLHEVHHLLLANSVVIVEGLNLSDVPAGKYELICLPLRIRSGKGDGAPARVVLRTFD